MLHGVALEHYIVFIVVQGFLRNMVLQVDCKLGYFRHFIIFSIVKTSITVKVINDTFSVFTATLDHVSNFVPVLLNVWPVVIHNPHVFCLSLSLSLEHVMRT